jgi:hypothetical protein
MIENIIKMLQLDDFYGKSETIDIAKGKYKIEKTVKGLVKQHKRNWKRKP